MADSTSELQALRKAEGKQVARCVKRMTEDGIHTSERLHIFFIDGTHMIIETEYVTTDDNSGLKISF